MKPNPVEHSVISPIVHRYSPYRFEQRGVEDAKLLQCLEAARWASSSYNEQPWSWIIARREDNEAFDQMLGCLLEANQGWAANAGVLMISVIRTTFRKNEKPNRVALHDLGQSSAFLSLQAVEVGLQVHQMAGVNLSATRQTYNIPDGHQPETAIAIGYPDESEPSDDADKQMHDRVLGSRQRLSLTEQVFAGSWGVSAKIG